MAITIGNKTKKNPEKNPTKSIDLNNKKEIVKNVKQSAIGEKSVCELCLQEKKNPHPYY